MLQINGHLLGGAEAEDVHWVGDIDDVPRSFAFVVIICRGEGGKVASFFTVNLPLFPEQI